MKANAKYTQTTAEILREFWGLDLHKNILCKLEKYKGESNINENFILRLREVALEGYDYQIVLQ